MAEKNYFEELNSVNVNEHKETKNKLDYLSWAWAWTEIKKKYPSTNYKVYENDQGWNYFTDGRTCWVKVGVLCNGIEHIEHLPIMDFNNRSIPLEKVTSFDVNKAIKRALAKAVADHGIGLYIYAGEDLPEEEAKPRATAPSTPSTKTVLCADCGKPITDHGTATAEALIKGTYKTYGKTLCYDCAVMARAKAEQNDKQ